MRRATISIQQADAKAPAEAKLLKTFRVTFCDTRYFHHDVKAIDADAATAIAESRNEGGDTGADSGEPYIEWVETSQLSKKPLFANGGRQ